MKGVFLQRINGTDSGPARRILLTLDIIIVLVFCYVLVNRPDYSFIEASLATGGLFLFLLVGSRS